MLRRATSPAVDLDKKRGNPYLRHGGSLLVHHERTGTIAAHEGDDELADADRNAAHVTSLGGAKPEVEKQEHLELRQDQQHRRRTARDAAAWTDRTREALVAATVGASKGHAGKLYLR